MLDFHVYLDLQTLFLLKELINKKDTLYSIASISYLLLAIQ